MATSDNDPTMETVVIRVIKEIATVDFSPTGSAFHVAPTNQFLEI